MAKKPENPDPFAKLFSSYLREPAAQAVREGKAVDLEFSYLCVDSNSGLSEKVHGHTLIGTSVSTDRILRHFCQATGLDRSLLALACEASPKGSFF